MNPGRIGLTMLLLAGCTGPSANGGSRVEGPPTDTPDVWNRLAASHPRSVIPHVYGAYDALLRKDPIAFDASLEKARAKLSGRATEHLAVGTVLLAAAQRETDGARKARLLEDAVRSLMEARKGDSKEPSSMFNLGLALQLSGRAGEAVPHLESYVERYPSERPPLRLIARCYLDQDEPGLALQWSQRPAVGSTLGAEDWELIGRCHYLMNQYERAESAYRESIRIDGKRAWAWNNLGLALQELGRTREADECFAKSRELRSPR